MASLLESELSALRAEGTKPRTIAFLRRLFQLIGAIVVPPASAGGFFFGASQFDGHTGDNQILSPGFDVSSTTETPAAPGIGIAKATSFTAFFVSHLGDAANADLTVTYSVLVNGVSVATSNALDASVDASQVVLVTEVPLAASDFVQIVGVPSAPLIALLTNVCATVQ